MARNETADSFAPFRQAYAGEWYKLAMTDLDGSNPHAKLSYQEEEWWGTLCELLYPKNVFETLLIDRVRSFRPDNLFGDRILSLDLFPKELYDHQSKWYKQKREKYGVPLDSRHLWAKVSLSRSAAAAASKAHLVRVLSTITDGLANVCGGIYSSPANSGHVH